MTPPDPTGIRRALLDFFDAHARDLPWRRTDDPYAIWVSEVMLQQTRVETVVPYFERWMRRFPTVEALADASLDDVLKAWEGLGYYRRARALHAGAGVVCERFGGRLPRETEGLREIPGVGEYTSGAVASIAFGHAVPAVDGNVRRVLARLYDIERPSAGRLRTLAADLVDPDRPGDFNQALMELGATVCTPRAPRCEACPVEGHCLARARGVETERPAPRARTAAPEADFAVALVVRPGEGGAGWRVAIERRPADGMLAGLWAFPELRLEAGAAVDAESAVRAAAAAGVGAGGPLARLPAVPHVYSHLRATYHPFMLEAGDGLVGGGGPAAGDDGSTRWADRDELARLALPKAQRTIARRLEAWLEANPLP